MATHKQYQAVFTSPEGYDVLNDLTACLFRVEENPDLRAILEGERKVAVRIISKLKEANHGKLEVSTPRSNQK